jgi:hypothetical protein
MTWSIAGITLPDNPRRVTIDYAADFKEISIPAAKSLLISLGRKVDKLRLEGVILDNTKTKAQLESTWIEPYRNAVYTEVAVDDGDPATDMYDGNWIMTKFECREIGGYTRHFEYIMELIQGSTHLVIS